MIDLIGDDHVPPFLKRHGRKMHAHVDAEAEARLSELNNYGRKKVSEDFSDSKFADRKPLKDEEQI